MVLVSFYL